MEYSENCIFWRYKVIADLSRPMLDKIGEENNIISKVSNGYYTG